MDAERVYLSMLGELIQPLPGVPNAFRSGNPCEMLYQEIYEAKCRLCSRLNTDEDADVESILDHFWALNRELCLQRYRLGVKRTVQRQ